MNSPMQRTGLTPPLRVLNDMPSNWRDVDLDFDTAADRLVYAHEHDGATRDLPVMDLRTWALKNERGIFSLAPLAGHERPRPLRATGLAHLLTRLGAPTEFVRDRLPAELQLGLIAYLMASHDRPLPAQLRLRGEEIAAVVSDRYTALDPVPFVETLRDALAEHGVLNEVRVRALATGPVDALRLVLPGEQRALRVGDISHVALDVSTSMFGKSAIHVRGSTFRLVCLNGLRVPDNIGSFSRRHIGANVREALRDAVPTALVHARGLMDRWQKAVGVYVNNVGAFIDNLRELTQRERALVGEELGKEVGAGALPERTSLYDLTNALTAAAHNVEPARRLELESLAGTVLHREVGRA